MTNTFTTHDNMVTWMGFGVQEAHFRVEFTNLESGNQYKKICYTQEEFDFVQQQHATPGHTFYGCEMRIIEVSPPAQQATA